MKRALLTLSVLTLAAAPLTGTVLAQSTAASAYPSGYTRAQLDAAVPLLDGLKTLQSSRLDLTQGRVVAVGLSAVDRLTLLVRLRQANLPTGIVDYQVGTAADAGATPPAPTTPATGTLPSATTLPAAGSLLAPTLRPGLSGPATLRAGQATTWSFTLTNSGTAAVNLAHGACDVRFEVISAAGEIVRPDPKDTLCTMQIVNTSVGVGETSEVQKIRWDGRGAGGQVLPAGTYTLRAVFSGAGAYSTPATLKVTLQ
ncbi:hypothetical protein HNQ07_001480 [Deinococcus metalli]|uniref:FlgD Ig-like domain-containing protein n=1 Tax=Deinococcus metalli TaxID=1141878 RepID=A0A7W8NQM6_9DEIO|nr:hypothetical protein [Deinococcus metalli]MBB5376023.1 hypothetical protein [Deinococcus metalli]GHF41399.1 hypothetical protein GCM10017781_17600 [Deinococcus metalli]